MKKKLIMTGNRAGTESNEKRIELASIRFDELLDYFNLKPEKNEKKTKRGKGRIQKLLEHPYRPNESKIKGDAMEWWTVLHSDISYGKDKAHLTEREWNLVSWRGDKSVSTKKEAKTDRDNTMNKEIYFKIIASESRYPDLELESQTWEPSDGKRHRLLMAVECKFRTKIKDLANYIKNNLFRGLDEYDKYCKERTPDIFLFVLGIGEDPYAINGDGDKNGCQLKKVLVLTKQKMESLHASNDIENELMDMMKGTKFCLTPSKRFINYEKFIRNSGEYKLTKK